VLVCSTLREKEKVIKEQNEKSDLSYLSFGFTCVGNKDAPGVQCIVCNKILVSSSVVPSERRRYFEINHAKYQGKDINFLRKCVIYLEIVNFQ
jgi:hypothetical protein